MIEDRGKKQIKAIENRLAKQLLDTDRKSIASLFSKNLLTEKLYR